MGKKTKIGRQRKDKFYFLAKEAGFRSRAAFKLLQLNKRFEFLQKSRALVDLCAAPGGWLQVAEQNMPVSSLRIGVDLVPIKAIKNCITIQGDITEEKTRHAVRKELNNWEADCVLHDGAPNVGTNWAHDAFQQNCLTLSALRLATQVLHRGGYFVTKIFRSADSQALIGVFEKLFKKVHVWKPAASRLESAEIFVVCEKYSKPDKVDPELLDVKKVFSTPQDTGEDSAAMLQRQLLHPGRKEKKPKALGYEEGIELSQYRELPASEFIASKNALQLLSRASALVLDSERTAQSEHTTEELRQCLADVKVCGPAEMRRILAWRRKLVEEQKREEREAQQQKAKEDGEAMPDATDEQAEEEEQQSSEMKELEEIDELIRNAQADEKARLKKRKKKLLKEKRKLTERRRLNMVHDGDEPTIGEDLELFSLKTIRRIAEKARAKALAAARAVKGEEVKEVKVEEKKHGQEKVELVELLDEEMDSSEDGKGMGEEELRDGERGDDEDGLDKMDLGENAMQKQSSRKRKLTPEQLAMGEQLIHSAKRAHELEDWAWNRHASNDDGLPDWFEADERKHCRPAELPVSRKRVQFYAQRDRPLNARNIKKVVEAKMRKRQRKQRRLDRAKHKAESILENEQMEQGEKTRELRKIYKKAAAPEKKKVQYQVVTKGKKGSISRPKGPYKLVDRRLKKDTRSQHKPKGGAAKRNGQRKPNNKAAAGGKKWKGKGK